MPAAEQRILTAGVRLAVLAVVGQSLGHAIDLVAFDLDIDYFNVDIEGSVFAWASAVTTFAVAWVLAVLAAAVALLSLDDAVGLHERLSGLKTELGPIDHFSRVFWPLALFPLLFGSFAGLWLMSRRLVPAAARILRIGLALLALAVVLEMSSSLLFELGADHGEWGYEWEAIAEEGAELAGWILIASALSAHLVGVTAAAAARTAPRSVRP